ncbi:hypothetical protein D3C73_1430710 [compost metagenome]
MLANVAKALLSICHRILAKVCCCKGYLTRCGIIVASGYRHCLSCFIHVPYDDKLWVGKLSCCRRIRQFHGHRRFRSALCNPGAVYTYIELYYRSLTYL